MKFSSITFENIKSEVESFLRKTYNKADQLFSPSSPYGQILNVLENLFQTSFLYLKNSIRTYDLSDVNANNRKVIRSNAIVAGHNPTRSISASGILKLNLRSSIDIESDIPGAKVTIFNKSQIKNKTNGFNYIIDLGGVDQVTYNISNNTNILLNVRQGRYEEDIRTGTGEINQSYSVEVPGLEDIENFDVQVSVNNENWSVKNHLYEILPNEKACVVRTGFEDGIEVIFGNESFGMVPPIASEIKITYLISNGARGNIFRRTVNDWDFIDDIIDGNGNPIDLEQLFNVQIRADINFGANGESSQFTKNILPLSSSNFVIATPSQYSYWIKRLGVFSHVNAFEENGTVVIVATPNIKLFKNRNANYFTVDEKAFRLDAYEKSKIDRYLKSGGNIQLTKKYTIDTPVLSYYIMNVFLIVYTDVNMDNLQSEIQSAVSEYFLDLNRINRVPKKDLINIISDIDGIDSVDIQFISKKTEDYHREFITKYENGRESGDIEGTIKEAFPEYNPNEIRGLDPVLGDIKFEANEIPIIRGGWRNRNNIYFSKDTSKEFSSLNIIERGRTDRNNRLA